MASQGFLGNACRLLIIVIRSEEDRESSRDFSPCMQDMIKGPLNADESVRYFHAVYNLPKKKQQELAKQKSRKAYYAKDWVQDRDWIVTIKRYIYAPTGGDLRSGFIRTNYDLSWAGHFKVRKTLDLVSKKYYWSGMRWDVI
jgi:hypothetical protein